MPELTGKKIVIIHGWSDEWTSMRKIGNPLAQAGANVYYVNYDSREDKAVYQDFAEGLQKELARQGLLSGPDKNLQFVTHSTGALVLRQWLKQYHPNSDDFTGNVVFLAPPNFGSPLASMGNSFIGKIFKGQHGTDYDDFEVGEQILHGLELASPLSWTLADHDLFGENGTIYHKDGIRASTITGHSGYGGLRYFVNKPGTDGTIVVAGANLNARKLQLNFVGPNKRGWSRWHGFQVDENPSLGMIPPNLPFAIHKGLNHATILDIVDHPTLRKQLIRCLNATPKTYDSIRASFVGFTQKQVGKKPELNYQQFLFHVVDDRGMPVKDYHLEFNVWNSSRLQESYKGGPRHVPRNVQMTRDEERRSAKLDELLERNLHTHSQDPSYKRYLLYPGDVRKIVGRDYVVTIRIDAKSGDKDITYRTMALDNILLYHPNPDFPVKVHPFYPNTTTLIEIRVDRESRLLQIGRKRSDFTD